MVKSEKTTSGQKKRARTEAERTKSLKCSNAFYHLGLVLTVIGIVFTILAMATCQLFHIRISTFRKDLDDYNYIDVPYGLYSSYGYKYKNDNETAVPLEHPLLTNTNAYLAAKILVLIGFFAAIIGVVIHVLFCVKENMRKRKIIFVQMIFLLIAMIGLLAGLSFAETEMETIHDDGSEPIAKFMVDNNLIKSKEIYIEDGPKEENGQGSKFSLLVTSLRFSFYSLIIATFMYLLAFLFALIYFVRLCEKINREESELCQNLNPDQQQNLNDTNNVVV